MNNNVKTIIKIVCIIISLVLLSALCFLTLSFDKAKKEELRTPVQITPVKETSKPEVPQKVIQKIEPRKPVTRDENNVPKSDYKVPEIG
mgnify:CR=1 FL=1